MSGDEIDEVADSVDLHLDIDADGSAILTVTMHDERLAERLYVLRTHGATREGDRWRLEVENLESITELQAHLVGMISDVVAPKPLTAKDREAVFDRDGNRCRMCGKDFGAPRIADSTDRTHTRIIDHIYPKADAQDVQTPNEPVNLATVCGGCDDVALQGDSIRFVPERIDKVLDRVDRQILAWLQKRPLARSDWLVHRLNDSRSEGSLVTLSLVEDRLLSFARLGLLRHESDIASDESFDVYRVNYHSPAVVFWETNAVERHREYLPEIESVDDVDRSLISMDERTAPRLPEVGGRA